MISSQLGRWFSLNSRGCTGYASRTAHACIAGSLLLSLAACRAPRKPAQDTPTGQSATASPKPSAPAQDTFRVTAESFADLRILRYRVPSFEKLSPKQKLLLYYLQEAALSGRDITYDQQYAHNLLVRRTLETVVTTYSGDRSTESFQSLTRYLKRIWFSNGIHHHYSSKKMLPEGVTPAEFAGYVQQSDVKKLPLHAGESAQTLVQKLTPILFDPNVAAKGVNKDTQADPVADSANHFYVGLTKDEVLAYTKQRVTPADDSPVATGLNSQLVKLPDGSIEERIYRVGGLYGEALSECVKWLEKALPLTETAAQHEALQRLITFYQTGSLEDWDRYSIAWVQDTSSKIDLIHGFIETYGDPLDMRATYEAMVQLEDEVATKRIRTLSQNAQWFEDKSPIQDVYKKPNVVGISARVIEAVMAAGATAPAMPIGVNLPNSAWIRQQHGSKSVTLGNVQDAYQAADRDNGVLEEFAAGPREIERALANGAIASALMVDMHEVIGHASGRLGTGVAEATETLRQYAGTLEEGRADLVALYYILDPKLVELKLIPSLDVGRAAYDAFFRGGLMVQLARIEPGENLEEAHMRNRQMIAKWCYEQGEAEAVIEKVSRAGKTYFAVRDYMKLRKLVGKLLREVQRIKSEGDFESGRDLVETYGVRVDPAVHKEVRERYALLGVAPYAGFIQPSLVPVKQGEQIVDVRIEYPEDFMKQQLDYSARYSFLPPFH